jgi:hypothetical protein
MEGYGLPLVGCYLTVSDAKNERMFSMVHVFERCEP